MKFCFIPRYVSARVEGPADDSRLHRTPLIYSYNNRRTLRVSNTWLDNLIIAPHKNEDRHINSKY